MLVYIMEAHATDEWPILDTETTFTQHKTLEERRRAVEFTCDSYPILESSEGFGEGHIFLDTIDNRFNTDFSSWPLRYWILHGGHVAFKAMPREAQYPLSDLEAALEDIVSV